MREISKSELIVCERLRPILASMPSDAAIAHFGNRRQALTALDFYLPEVLRQSHPEWEHESLDGIYPEVARKTGVDELEIIGLCKIISDQTLTPIHLRLQLDSVADAVSWLDCRLGESAAGGMLKVPYSPSIVYGSKPSVLARLESIDWVYRVGFGERRT